MTCASTQSLPGMREIPAEAWIAEWNNIRDASGEKFMFFCLMT